MEKRKPMETHIGKEIIILSNLIKRRMRSASEALGVTDTQARVIQYISEEGKKREIFQKDIEDTFCVRRSSVTQIIQLLERDGYITRESVERDARLKKLVLTEKGSQIDKVMKKQIKDMEAELKKNISPQEKETLINILYKVRKNLGEEN